MPAIALIGPDGAGKTTLTRMLRDSGVLPFRCLYMGVNTSSSNVALPTSRLVERSRSRTGATVSRRPRGPVWRTARLLNRIAEEWFRQSVSWYYQARGYTVLYDRHYLFDFSSELATGVDEGLDKRLHRRLLQAFYPRPDMVIVLDAPGSVLYARKGELTPPELERRRMALLRAGARQPGFVRIDATRPLLEVYAEIESLVIARFGGRARHGSAT